MSQCLNVAKKHVIEYAFSGYFNYGQEQLHNLLDDLDIEYTTVDEYTPEYDREFSINRRGLKRGITLLKRIDKEDEEACEQVDVEDLCNHLDDASMTLAELIECFEWMLRTAEPNDKEYVHVSFF